MLVENYKIEFIKSNEKLDLNSLEKFLNQDEALTQVNDLIKFFEILKKENFEISEKFNYIVWNFLSRSGKISKALDYASSYLDYLFINKRIPAIKKFLIELKEASFPKKKIERYEQKLKMILGDKAFENTPLFDELFDWHDEYWKTHKDSLKRSILSYEKWDVEFVKMLYEFTLKYYFDPEIMEKYKENILENKKFNKDLISYLKTKGINLLNKKFDSKESQVYKIDYDQLAYTVVSGKKHTNNEEQVKVILSIENMSFEEIINKGQEMLVAFRMLGMSEVVLFLSDRLLNFDINEKEKLSIAYVKAETLSEDNDFYGLIKFTEEVIRELGVDKNELLAFYYLCFDTAMRQNKLIKAKVYAEKIKAVNKNYRDVNKRLMRIEKN